MGLSGPLTSLLSWYGACIPPFHPHTKMHWRQCEDVVTTTAIPNFNSLPQSSKNGGAEIMHKLKHKTKATCSDPLFHCSLYIICYVRQPHLNTRVLMSTSDTDAASHTWLQVQTFPFQTQLSGSLPPGMFRSDVSAHHCQRNRAPSNCLQLHSFVYMPRTAATCSVC